VKKNVENPDSSSSGPKTYFGVNIDPPPPPRLAHFLSSSVGERRSSFLNPYGSLYFSPALGHSGGLCAFSFFFFLVFVFFFSHTLLPSTASLLFEKIDVDFVCAPTPSLSSLLAAFSFPLRNCNSKTPFVSFRVGQGSLILASVVFSYLLIPSPENLGSSPNQ